MTVDNQNQTAAFLIDDRLKTHRKPGTGVTLVTQSPNDALGMKEEPDRTARRVRHKKRGTTYTVVGTAELQIATTDLVDGSFLTIYQGEDGKWWARDEHEFEDGRFEDVP